MLKVTGNWRKMHSEELHDLYFSLNTIGMIERTKHGLGEQMARVGRGEVHRRFWSEGRRAIERPTLT